MSGSNAMMSNKKQREVYVGNLTIGVVNDVMLRDLFNGALSHLVADPHVNPPVVSTSMDPSGRFGFVELRTEELAQAAMQLDKVELCGRSINVGRPKGYVEPPPGARPIAVLGAAQAFAAKLGTVPTTVLRLDNMVKAVSLLDAQEYSELVEDVEDEAKRYGAMQELFVPQPPPTVGPDEPARVFIRYAQPLESEAAKKVFDGRTFDGNRISARYVSEEDLRQAQTGGWNPGTNGSLPPPPGMPGFGAPGGALAGMPTAFPNVMVPGMPSAPLPGAFPGGGFPGAYPGAMQQPAPAAMAAPQPVAAGMPAGPNEGWVKLRGIPFTAGKQDLITFFQGCALLREDQIKLVVGPDNRPTGDAFVEITGPGANLALALAKDRQVMPNSSRYVEIFSSSKDEVDRRALAGGILV